MSRKPTKVLQTSLKVLQIMLKVLQSGPKVLQIHLKSLQIHLKPLQIGQVGASSLNVFNSLPKYTALGPVFSACEPIHQRHIADRVPNATGQRGHE